MKKLAPSSLADIAKEIATDADKFTISFPQDLKVSHEMTTEPTARTLQEHYENIARKLFATGTNAG